MSIFSKVTLKTLLKNRVRTLVTVIGIILSAAMITAVTVSLTSLTGYLQRYMALQTGGWHGTFCEMPASDLPRLESDGRVKSVFAAQIMGVHDTSHGDGGGYIYIRVLGVDGEFLDRMPINVTEGRLPESPEEIALSFSEKSTDVRIGSEITLDLGERYLDGELLGDHTWYVSGEELRVRDARTYTVVGFCTDDFTRGGNFPGTTAITLWDDSAEPPYVQAWFTLRDPGDTFDFLRDFPQGAYGGEENADYLMTLGYSRRGTFYRVLYGFAAILLGLIMFGSVSLIYNAFSISVAERTRQFGLLRSVGATKRQLRSMVLTEALFVSLAGIPLGILSGVVGMAVTFHFIGKAIADFFAGYMASEEADFALTLRLTPWSVISAAAIGLVTVLISAWVPSRRAMRVTAIEAIRQSEDVKIRRREVRTWPLTYRLFGLEGAIAGKYFKRDRKRYRATVVSLFMSVVLFISASSFCRYMTDTVRGVYDDSGYDISLYCAYDTAHSASENEGSLPSTEMSRVASVLSRAESVTEWSAFKELNLPNLSLGAEDIPEDTLERFFGGAFAASEDSGSTAPGGGDTGEDGWCVQVSATVIGLEDVCFREYLSAHGLREADYTGEHPKVIVYSETSRYNRDTERVERFRILRPDKKTLEFSVYDDEAARAYYESLGAGDMTWAEREEAGIEEKDFTRDYSYEIGAMTEDLPLGSLGGDIVILTSADEARRICGSTRDVWYMYFRTDDHENGLAKILDASEDAGLGLSEDQFYDTFALSARERGLVLMVRVVSWGFISLISAIAAANVFNTVSTNILLRRREFAMLRSVGMTDRGFNRMMNFECLRYGARSLLYGLPAAFAVTYLIYRTVRRAMDIRFYVPWTAVAVAVGSVFLVVFLSMMYSMAGVKRDNPIDAMKNEVI